LKNKSAGEGCRDKTIEKTILRAFLARPFLRSQGQKLKSSMRAYIFRFAPIADLAECSRHFAFVPMLSKKSQMTGSETLAKISFSLSSPPQSSVGHV
jgi:hypothetical protein